MKLKSLSSQYFKQINILYATALSFIAIVLLSSSLLIQKNIDENSSDSRVINISGRQRMLSQKISKDALILNNAKEYSMDTPALSELNTSVALWAKSQKALRFGDIELGIPSQKLSKDIDELFGKIEIYHTSIITAARELSNIYTDYNGADKADKIGKLTEVILTNERQFLPLMDKITFLFDMESKQKAENLKRIERILLLVGFLVLMFEFLFVFRPTTKQLSLAVKSLMTKQQELAEANRALAQSLDESKYLEKLANSANEAKSTFLANMTHEIRTPMNSILGFSEILKKQITDPVQIHYLDVMLSSGEVLLTLINDILDLSKIEAGKLNIQVRSVNLHKTCAEVADTFQLMAKEKGLDFSFIIEEEIPYGLLLDEVRIRQVLFNLLGNAVKFTEKGSIAFKVSVYGYSEKQSKFNILFEIADTGIGIPKEALKLIFEPFEQQSKQDNKKYGGTGLGLSITQKLVNMMNGQIWVDSINSKGSTFRVRIDDIPIASVVDEQSNYGKMYEFEPAVILIVDDVDTNRELLAEYLSVQPFKVMQAENGITALKKIQLSKPDLILTDMRMPVMDGYTLATKLKQDSATKNIPIIAVTASSLARTEEEVREVCTGYLTKPVSSSVLFAELAKHLATKETAIDKITTSKNQSMVTDYTCKALERDEMLLNLDEDFITEILLQADILSYEKLESIHYKIRNIATKHNCEVLLGWCKELNTYMSVFDMQNTEETLRQLPKIVEEIKGAV